MFNRQFIKLDTSKPWFRLAMWLVFGFAVIINLLTLRLSPLPWFDEVFFADISKSVAETSKMDLAIYPGIFKEEITTYGPVYFWVQGFSIRFFDLDILSFRLLNFLAGLLCIWLFSLLVGRSNRNLALPFGVLLLYDPIFVQNMHSGRMDLVMLAFGLAALNLILVDNLKDFWFRIATSGLLLSLAYLTSPRAIFFIAPLFLLLLFKAGLLRTLIASILFVVPVTLYVVNYFGDFQSYYGAFTDNSAVVAHIGLKKNSNVIFRYWYHIFLYTGVLLSMAWYLFQYRTTKGYYLPAIGVSIIAFHLLVVEKGPYSALISPFYLLLIAGCMQLSLQTWLKNLFGLLAAASFLLFASYFLIKQSLIFDQFQLRDDNLLQRNVAKLPFEKGEKVIASFEYYYALNKNNVNYIGYEIPINLYRRIGYHLDSTEARYMLLSNKDLAGHQFGIYMRTGRVEKVMDLFKTPVKYEPFYKRWKFLKPFFPHLPTYEGSLYRIIPR